jgi:amino acid transporter
VWRSVFWSAVSGWFVLLALLFAATDVQAVNDAGGTSNSIVTTALANDLWAAKLILIIVTVGQLFCAAACLTSCSRTWYAFSRDRAIPGWTLFQRLNRDRVPLYAVIAVSVFSLLITLPALGGKNDIPFAFFAISGICTVGLYIAYILPVYLRLRAGDSFQTGPWNLGSRYRLINILAIIFVALVVYSLVFLPYSPTGLPWNDDFDWAAFNYVPLAILIPLIFGVWYLISAKNKYQGPVKTLEEDVVTRD